MKLKDLWIVHEMSKTIKEKDRRRNWFWRYGIWSTWNGKKLQISNLTLYLHNIINIIFQMKITQNLKILKTAQEVRDHKEKILLIKHKK